MDSLVSAPMFGTATRRSFLTERGVGSGGYGDSFSGGHHLVSSEETKMTRIEGDSVDGHRKETVSISFLTVHEVDPDEFDLRVKKPEKIREQLVQAADSCGWIQKPIETTDEALERYRQKIEDARSCGDRSVGAYRRTR